MSLDKKLTVVMIQRERFNFTRSSLESVYQNANCPFNLVYVDGGSPPPVRDYLAAEATRRGFRVIRTEHLLTPTEARNLGVAAVQTPYVVFVDNDVLVLPGWLEPLVKTAEREQAWAVGPTYLWGRPEQGKVHMTGGTVGFVQQDGRRRFDETHRHLDESYERVRAQLRPEPTGLVEFHCMLVRRDIFDRLGPLDEGFMSLLEHVDLCMCIGAAGGLIYFEPRSVACHVPPDTLDRTDLPFFLLRWSDEWNRASVDRMTQKYSLDRDDPYAAHQLEFGERLRERALPRIRWPLGKVAGVLKYRASESAGRRLARWVEAPLTDRVRAMRAAALKPQPAAVG